MSKSGNQPEDLLTRAEHDQHNPKTLRDLLSRAFYDGKLRIKVKGHPPSPLSLSLYTLGDVVFIECVMRKPDIDFPARELFDVAAHANEGSSGNPYMIDGSSYKV